MGKARMLGYNKPCTPNNRADKKYGRGMTPHPALWATISPKRRLVGASKGKGGRK